MEGPRSAPGAALRSRTARFVIAVPGNTVSPAVTAGSDPKRSPFGHLRLGSADFHFNEASGLFSQFLRAFK